jgi:hypothetical protein
MVFVCLSIAGAPEARAEGESIVMSQDGRISMDLVDARLDAVLSNLSKKAPLHVKGRPGASDRLTVHFSGLTLEEALHKLMAGYNYALFLPPQGHKGTATLTIVGKAVPGATVSPAETAATVSTPPVSPSAEQQPPARTPRHDAGAPPVSSAQPQPAQTTALPVQPAPAAAQSAPAVPSLAAPDQPVVQPPPPEQSLTPPAGPGQQQATGQAAQPDATAAATPPGVLPAPDSEPPFNPAAWGGIGRRK